MFSTNNSSKPRAWYAKQPRSTDHLSQIQRDMSKFQHHTPDQQKAKLTELLTRAVVDKQSHSVSQKSFKESVQSLEVGLQKQPPSTFKSMALPILEKLREEQSQHTSAPQQEAPPAIQRGFINTIFNRLEPKPILEKHIQTLADVFQDNTISHKDLSAAVKDYLNPKNHEGIPPRIRVQLFNEFISNQIQKNPSEEYSLMDCKLNFSKMALSYLDSIGSKSLPTPGMFDLVHGETARQRQSEKDGGKAVVQTAVGELTTTRKGTLGAGAFGTTKTATTKDNTYVIKKIPISQSSWQKNYLDFFAATQEALIGKQLSSHPNIAKTMDMYVYDDAKPSGPKQRMQPESKFVIVMEKGVRNGDSFLEDPNVTPPKKVQFLLDIAQGLTHIHEAGFVHNDVKPDNFLVFEGDVGKVADFGRSGRIGDLDPDDTKLETREDTGKFRQLLKDQLPDIFRTHYGPKSYYTAYSPVERVLRDDSKNSMSEMITLLKDVVQQLETPPLASPTIGG